jgi:hypothetical protein
MQPKVFSPNPCYLVGTAVVTHGCYHTRVSTRVPGNARTVPGNNSWHPPNGMKQPLAYTPFSVRPFSVRFRATSEVTSLEAAADCESIRMRLQSHLFRREEMRHTFRRDCKEQVLQYSGSACRVVGPVIGLSWFLTYTQTGFSLTVLSILGLLGSILAIVAAVVERFRVKHILAGLGLP